MYIPKVSVIVPAYNIEKYIEATLLSIKNQSFKDFEVLVVDDGSVDRTAEIIKSFCAKDSRFKLLQKPNGGLSSARNYGISNSLAEYIAPIDGDDIYGVDKLKTHVAVLDAHPEVGIVYSASRAIRDDGGSTFISLSGKPIYSDPLLSLLCKNFIGHGSNAIFRRCIVDEVGGFDETLRRCPDLDFWVRIAATKKWQFHREPEVHCFYRVRPSGLSFNLQEMQLALEKVIDAACKRSPELVEPILPTAYAYMNRYFARTSLTSGDIRSANEYINKALENDPSIFLKDPRSLLTFISVRLAPLSRLVINRSLGTFKSKTN